MNRNTVMILAFMLFYDFYYNWVNVVLERVRSSVNKKLFWLFIFEFRSAEISGRLARVWMFFVGFLRFFWVIRVFRVAFKLNRKIS